MDEGTMLWFVRTVSEHLECDFGHKHYVDVVRDAVLAMIVETKDVRGEWRPDLFVNGGLRAVSLDGSVEFKSNWNTYDDASMDRHWTRTDGSSLEHYQERWRVVTEYTNRKRYHDPDNLLPEGVGSGLNDE